jgi:orotidine-5'-phosphate decarboxylase
MNRKELIEQVKTKRSYLCVGLDTDVTKIPTPLQSVPDGVLQFNKAIIEATRDHCVAYKINTAFYEALGVKGWQIIEETLAHIPSTHFKIADAKRGDIGNTSAQYAKTFFETFAFDAVTVAPYMGEDSIRPFLDYTNKFTIVLGLTSNKGANDFEYLKTSDDKFVYEKVISKISSWATPENLMFVIGATQAKELENIRKIIPDNFLLIPGVGAQGGSLKDVSDHGMNKDCGLLVNVGRSIIYASGKKDYAEEAARVAKEYNEEMKKYLLNWIV